MSLFSSSTNLAFHELPILTQIVVLLVGFVLLAALIFQFDLKPLQIKLNNERGENTALHKQFAAQKKQLLQLKIKPDTKDFFIQDDEVQLLVNKMSSFTKSAGVQIITTKKFPEKNMPFYKVLTVNYVLQGSLESFLVLLKNLQKSRHLISLDTLKVLDRASELKDLMIVGTFLQGGNTRVLLKLMDKRIVALKVGAIIPGLGLKIQSITSGSVQCSEIQKRINLNLSFYVEKS